MNVFLETMQAAATLSRRLHVQKAARWAKILGARMRPTPRDLSSLGDEPQSIAQVKITRTRSGSSLGGESAYSAADRANEHADALRKAAAAAAAAAAKAMPKAKKLPAQKAANLKWQRLPSRPQDIACKFYARGCCRKGTSCPFSHSATPVAAAVPPARSQSRRPPRRFHRKRSSSGGTAAAASGLSSMMM